jgi:hypothetical protein
VPTSRDRLPWSGGPFQAFAMACIHPWYLTKYRARWWGKLPYRRGSTLVLCNHQHDLDTTITVMYMSVRGPLYRPIYCVGSRRVFEPGFMAWRIRFLEPLLRNVGMTLLFRLLGVLPIENEPRRRSLATLAWAIYRKHGDLRFGDVFRDGVLGEGSEALSNSRFSSVFAHDTFRKMRDRYFSIASLREPYRSELTTELRTQVEQDLALIESVLRGGGTLYLTPEGKYSKDGKMNRFRKALDLLAPLAESIYALAVSYDPFAAKRLSMLFSLWPVRDRNDLRSSLAAPRPVTISQLLAPFLLGNGAGFTGEQARASVLARLHSLPSGAFVDPEVTADPGKLTARALAYLTKTGVLQATPDGYRLTEKRKDERFPEVADIVEHQANHFAETVEALERLAASSRSSAR